MVHSISPQYETTRTIQFMLTNLPEGLLIHLAAFLNWDALKALTEAGSATYAVTNRASFWRAMIITRKSFLPLHLKNHPYWHAIEQAAPLKRFYALYSLSLQDDASDDKILLLGTLSLSADWMRSVLLVIGQPALLETYCQKTRATLDGTTLEDAVELSPLPMIRYLIEEKKISVTDTALLKLLARDNLDVFQYAIKLLNENRIIVTFGNEELWNNKTNLIGNVLFRNHLPQLEWLHEAGYLTQYMKQSTPHLSIKQLIGFDKIKIPLLQFLIQHQYVDRAAALQNAKEAKRFDLVECLETDCSQMPSDKRPMLAI